MKRTLTLLLLSQAISLADWLQFRGPSGSGTSPTATLPESLNQDKSIAWKQALPGEGLSSPIVVGDRVYVTCSSGPKQNRLHVICFRAGDGGKVWERQFWATGRTMCHEKTSVAAPTPASDGQRIVAFYSSNDLICLDLDGNLLWLRGLTSDYANASNSLGMASSLVISGGIVVAQVENDSESFTAGIDISNGKNRWKLDDRPKAANWTSPVTMTDSSGKEFVAIQSSKGVIGVEPATGKVAWKFANGADTIASSTGGKGVLFVPSNGLTAIEPTPDGQTKQLWQVSQLRPATASPVLLNDRIYVINGTGVLQSVDAKTGERSWRVRLKGPFGGSPVAAGKFLHIYNEEGLGQLVDLTGAEGKVVSEINLGEMIQCTPAVSQGAVYVRSDKHLWKIVGA